MSHIIWPWFGPKYDQSFQTLEEVAVETGFNPADYISGQNYFNKFQNDIQNEFNLQEPMIKRSFQSNYSKEALKKHILNKQILKK